MARAVKWLLNSGVVSMRLRSRLLCRLHRYPGGLDHLPPQGEVFAHELAELLRRAGRCHQAVGFEAARGLGIAESFPELTVEPFDDCARNSRRSEQSVITRVVEARDRFGNGRHIGQ